MRSQLLSYIAPAAPATRRPARGGEAFLRPEIGFTPAWYRQDLAIDFGEAFHTDPACRRACLLDMHALLEERFPGTGIGAGPDGRGEPLDLLTGTFGATVVAGIYGMEIVFAPDQWPTVGGPPLGVEEIDVLEPPDLDRSRFFQGLMDQVDWIAGHHGPVVGFLNWQGILNNALRLRGQELFIDLLEEPQRCHRLFTCIGTTMIDGIKRLQARQRATGADYRFATLSNCTVNLVSATCYRDQVRPHDQRIAAEFDSLGLHNCAWKADPYLDEYAALPNLGYIDMGIDSDLVLARRLFPQARRAVMYKPTDLSNKPPEAIRADLDRIGREFGPCDLVCADIEAGTPDERIHHLLDCCREISNKCDPGETSPAVHDVTLSRRT